jgi:hypothetical protein
MKKTQAKQIIDGQINRFGEEIAAVRFESMFSVYSFKDAHESLTRRVETLKFQEMWTAVPAKDVTQSPPAFVSIGGRRAKDQELINILIDNLNNQNLWLFVLAYEALERFYKDFYAALGYLDRNLWLCSDFGTVKIGDLRAKDLQWFQAQVRKTVAKHNIDGILQSLRNSFPNFAKAESGDVFDLKMWFGVAALFRNVIVHSDSRIAKEELTQRLEKATGLSFTGERESVKMRWRLVHRYIRLSGNYYELEAINRSMTRPPYHLINSPVDSLIEKLTSHAYLAYKVAMIHFGQQPLWERQDRTG